MVVDGGSVKDVTGAGAGNVGPRVTHKFAALGSVSFRSCGDSDAWGEACVVAAQSNQAGHRHPGQSPGGMGARSAHGVSRRRRCSAARLLFDAGERLRREAPTKTFLRETLPPGDCPGGLHC